MGKKTRLADVPMPVDGQEFFTRLEACKFARIGPSTFDKAVRDKKLKVRWNGNKQIVERAEIMRYIRSLPSEHE